MGNALTGGEKTQNRYENGKYREENGPFINHNFELKGVHVHDESEERGTCT